MILLPSERSIVGLYIDSLRGGRPVYIFDQQKKGFIAEDGAFTEMSDSALKKISGFGGALYIDFYAGSRNLDISSVSEIIKIGSTGLTIFFVGKRDAFGGIEFRKLNSMMYSRGGISHLYKIEEQKEADDSMYLWRYEIGAFSRKTKGLECEYTQCCSAGVLKFSEGNSSGEVLMMSLFEIHSGAKTGLNRVFYNQVNGNELFVASETAIDGSLRNGVVEVAPGKYLNSMKRDLIASGRNNNNWWKWSRREGRIDGQRIYVSKFGPKGKCFFVHECNRYDTSVMALFTLQTSKSIHGLCSFLNKQDWIGNGCSYSAGKMYISKERLKSSFVPVEVMDYFGD